MAACTFIGHKDFTFKYYSKLCEAIENLILSERVNEFYVGTNGAFDRSAYRALCDLEKKYKIRINVITAYLNQKDLSVYKQNEIIFPEILEKTPYRYAINKRNFYMIEKSQYMICYMNHTFSNTYNFVNRAAKRKLKIINIGEYDISNL